MSCGTTIINANRDYWTNRAASYSDVNKYELENSVNQWSEVIYSNIDSAINLPREEIKVLDIGTGPGFFATILARGGYNVTAIDLTPNMLKEAKANVGEYVDRINFMEMNAEELSFEDEAFHVVISRNLTWDLPHPEKAYSQWTRVIKKGGLLLNFDANWYNYLYYDEAKEAFKKDKAVSKELNFDQEKDGVKYSDMEEIAKKIPLSSIIRPTWDKEILSQLGMNVVADTSIWEKVWTEKERLSYASTPLFLIKATKNA